MAENDERTPPGRAPGDEELRDRIARARESINRSLRAVAEQAQHDEAALRAQAADELSRVAAAELERSLTQFAKASEELVSTRLAEAVDRLDAGAADRRRAELAEVRRVAQATAERHVPRQSRRERRHGLKLAKAESSRRVSRALTRLEQRGGALMSELDARSEAAAIRIEAAERRLRAAAAELGSAESETGRRLTGALLRVDGVVGRVGEARQRVAAIEAKALASAARAAASAELGANAAQLEGRLRDALELEARAAERISAAERRLLAALRET